MLIWYSHHAPTKHFGEAHIRNIHDVHAKIIKVLLFVDISCDSLRCDEEVVVLLGTELRTGTWFLGPASVVVRCSMAECPTYYFWNFKVNSYPFQATSGNNTDTKSYIFISGPRASTQGAECHRRCCFKSTVVQNIPEALKLLHSNQKETQSIFWEDHWYTTWNTSEIHSRFYPQTLHQAHAVNNGQWRHRCDEFVHLKNMSC